CRSAPSVQPDRRRDRTPAVDPGGPARLGHPGGRGVPSLTMPSAQPSPTVRVALRRLDDGLPVPRQARPDDAGVDLHAREDRTLAPGERALVPTGVAIALPPGYAAFVHPRSGLAARH